MRACVHACIHACRHVHMYVHTYRYRCMLKSTSMIEQSWQHVLKLLRLIYKACLCLGSAPLLTRSPAAVSSGLSSAGSRDSAVLISAILMVVLMC